LNLLARAHLVKAFCNDSPCLHLLQHGFIVVNGVLASAHSEFLLDEITPAALVHLLPGIYQAMFAPLYQLYRLLGPARSAALNSWLTPVVNAAVAAVTGGSAAPVAAAATVAALAVAVSAAKTGRARMIGSASM
jgi:hypothetical protein